MILVPSTAPRPHEAAAEVTSQRLAIENGRTIHIESPHGFNAFSVAGAVCHLVNFPGGSYPLPSSRPIDPPVPQPVPLPVPHPPERSQPLQVQRPNVGIRCWDTRTGKQVRDSQVAWSGRASLSAGGGIVAIMDTGLPESTNVLPSLPVRSLWDFKSGKIIAQCSPEPEAGSNTGFPRRTFVISADGRMVAHASSDSVVLYRVR